MTDFDNTRSQIKRSPNNHALDAAIKQVHDISEILAWLFIGLVIWSLL